MAAFTRREEAQMALLTYSDWVQWGSRCAVAECEDSVRARFEKFLSFHVGESIKPLPEWLRSLLAEYLEDNADGRRRCVTVFDSYMLRGRKKAALLACTPRNPNPTEEDYAGAWSAYAQSCIHSMVREIILKEVQRFKERPVRIDEPIREGETETRGASFAGADRPIEESIAFHEAERKAEELELSERERLVLWADQHGEDRTSEKMEQLAGCKKSQLSKCAKQLEVRICTLMMNSFALESHEHNLAVEWTDWAWQYLAKKFEKISPERDESGGLIWVKDEPDRPPILHVYKP